MKTKFLTLLLFLISLPLIAGEPPKTPSILNILNDQVDAFNQRDVKRLVENVTEDFIWYSLTSDELLVETKGKKAFKKSMENYYQARKKKIHSRIENYVIDGDRISFREVVNHLDKNGKTVSSSALGIYQIQGEKISRAWYFVD